MTFDGHLKGGIVVTGKYIFPGMIDVQVHPVNLEDGEASSRFAAYGGTTPCCTLPKPAPARALRQPARDVFEIHFQETLDPYKDHWELCSRGVCFK